MKSIIQTNKDNCFICGMRANEEHHCIYGIANRKLSEKYGLKVYLCTDCHRTGKYAVHRCHEIDLKLKKIAQRKFEKQYPKLSFLKIFRKKLFIGGNGMGDHHKSDREKRKRKYQEQFARTERNKKRKAEKRQRKLQKNRK